MTLYFQRGRKRGTMYLPEAQGKKKKKKKNEPNGPRAGVRHSTPSYARKDKSVEGSIGKKKKGQGGKCAEEGRTSLDEKKEAYGFYSGN